ncbi:MAG: hypothetical protein BWY79_00647 [Actinobacteria bacterium ADurb.Bin444]|nr:MAG: hypothetical protein BWY79_00647 [Actinobacteria bacterium ADurb.Bin444]
MVESAETILPGSSLNHSTSVSQTPLMVSQAFEKNPATAPRALLKMVLTDSHRLWKKPVISSQYLMMAPIGPRNRTPHSLSQSTTAQKTALIPSHTVTRKSLIPPNTETKKLLIASK